MEELRAKHRKEQKDLQSRIVQKKKNATKKTRKGVNDECESLERELLERQQAELSTINGSGPNEDFNESSSDEEEPIDRVETTTGTKKVNFHPSTLQEGSVAPSQTQKAKKPNRQKARLARRAAEQEAQATAAAEEASSLPDMREREMASMKDQMDALGLTETFVRPDGHCLFSACALGIPSEQVSGSGPFSEGYQNVRFATAEYMSQHPDDFSAFLEEPLDSYVKKIKDTAEWGGQLELQAISRSYKVTINVLQADGRTEKITPEGEPERQLWLAYYRHSFGLGEHYNALSKIEGR